MALQHSKPTEADEDVFKCENQLKKTPRIQLLPRNPSLQKPWDPKLV